MLLPISRELAGDFQLGFTGSIDAAVDADRDGRHLAYGAVVGLDAPVSETLSVTFELSAKRNEDPARATTSLLGGVSAAWTLSDSLQLDLGANLGLDRDAADGQLYIGVARRF